MWEKDGTMPDIREFLGIAGEEWNAATIAKLGIKPHPAIATLPKQERMDTAGERRRRRIEDEKREVDDDDIDDEKEEEYDPWEYEAFRCDWSIFSCIHGSFEDTSEFNLLIQ